MVQPMNLMKPIGCCFSLGRKNVTLHGPPELSQFVSAFFLALAFQSGGVHMWGYVCVWGVVIGLDV